MGGPLSSRSLKPRNSPGTGIILTIWKPSNLLSEQEMGEEGGKEGKERREEREGMREVSSDIRPSLIVLH